MQSVNLVRQEAAPPDRSDVPALREAFLAGRSEATRRAYGSDLAAFARFLGVEDIDQAAALLLSGGHGPANGLALRWRASLLESGLSAATINRRLAALRSLVKLARTLGLVPWQLEVESIDSQPYRDTRGPGRVGFLQLLEQTRAGDGAKPIRDRAILRLMYDVALRRAEVVRLDVEDVDLEAATVAVLGKGRSERERLTLPAPTVAALTAWLELRGTAPGPLFTNFDRAQKGERLTGRSVYRVVKRLGERAGVRARPHGLRHAAITEALELTGGNVRAVQRFSRHRDLRTLNIYDDNRQDLAGEVAALVAGAA